MRQVGAILITISGTAFFLEAIFRDWSVALLTAGALVVLWIGLVAIDVEGKSS